MTLMFNKYGQPVDRAKLLTKLRELEDEWRAFEHRLREAELLEEMLALGELFTFMAQAGAMATRWPKDCRASGIRKKQLTP